MFPRLLPCLTLLVSIVSLTNSSDADDERLPIIAYNPLDGMLSVSAPAGLEFRSISLRILGNPRPFDFNTGIATWLDPAADVYDVVDLPEHQAFLSVPGLQGEFTMENGDAIGRLLAPNIPDSLLHNRVSILFQIVGQPGTHDGKFIPEAPTITLLLISSIMSCSSMARTYCRIRLRNTSVRPDRRTPIGDYCDTANVG
jgi:hypothetical protein